MVPKQKANQNQNQNATDASELRNTNYLLVPHPRIELFKKPSLDKIRFQQCKPMFRRGLKENLLNKIQV
jgi:hypothetical protein